MLTKAWVSNLDEQALRKEVLIPLLEAMKHKDVREYHGGTEEQGKDIVSWKPDDLGGRKNFALVVKAIPINGQANTRRGSAGEVRMQIEQSFGEGFRDSVTNEEHSVHECWVVTNKKISNEALKSLESALATSGRDRYVKFIDGDKLWSLIEEYMPAARALEIIGEVDQIFDELDPDFRPTVQMKGKEIVVGIEPKSPGAAAEKPPEMQAKVSIPRTPEHEALIQSIQQHFATGAPVEIPGSFVQMTLPDALARLLGTDVGALKLGRVRNEAPLLADIEFVSEDRDYYALPYYVHFSASQIGTEEITLTNEGQPIPIHIKLVVHRADQRADIEITFASPPINVHQFRQIFQLTTITSKPYTMRVIHLDTGIPFFHTVQAVPTMTAPPTAAIELLNDLDAIQTKIMRPIMLPAREFTRDEEVTIAKLREILHKGEWSGTGGGRIRASFSPNAASEALQYSEQEGVKLFRAEADQTEHLFGTDIPLGPAIITIRDVTLANEAEVRAKLAEARGDEEAIELVYDLAPDSTHLYQYPDWGATVSEWRTETEGENEQSNPADS